MNKFVLCVLLCLITIACRSEVKPEVKKAFMSTVFIQQNTITDNGEACTAVIIGPQALITASHCEMPTDELIVSILPHPVHIKERIRDGADHTIYLIDDITFPNYVDFEPNKVQQTEEVFTWGNPDGIIDVYRQGVFSAVYQKTSPSPFGPIPEGPPELLFDIQNFPGDSGAGLFTKDGVLVEIESQSYVSVDHTDKDFTIHFTVAYPIVFTPEDVARAKAFTTPQKQDPKKAPGDEPAFTEGETGNPHDNIPHPMRPPDMHGPDTQPKDDSSNGNKPNPSTPSNNNPAAK